MHPTGLITALATPFDEAGALDLGAWRRLLEWQLAAGVEGVVVANGLAGEEAARVRSRLLAVLAADATLKAA